MAFIAGAMIFATACSQDSKPAPQKDEKANHAVDADFNWNPENFADKKIVRY